MKSLIPTVYAHPKYIETLNKSTPIADHVFVDFELRGCPISKTQLVEVVSAYLHGRKPNIPRYSVCMECKRSGTPCVLVSQGSPCLGPVTQAGCNGLCPAYGRACFGCFGPMETPNTHALAVQLKALGLSDPEVTRAFRSFNAYAEVFRREGDAHDSA
jgi:coenzyme F420-reducing hydrogenase gamma subunit